MVPGTFGTNYTYPDPSYAGGYSSVDYFMNKGMTTFRIPFRWERLQPRRGQLSLMRTRLRSHPSDAWIIRPGRARRTLGWRH